MLHMIKHKLKIALENKIGPYLVPMSLVTPV